MRFLSLKAAIVYLSVSVILYAYQFISLWGVYYEMASQKPVYPTLHYLNQLLNPVNIFFERNIMLFLFAMILVPVLNVLSLVISAIQYKKSKKNVKLVSLTLIVVALIQWLIFFYMRFYR